MDIDMEIIENQTVVTTDSLKYASNASIIKTYKSDNDSSDNLRNYLCTEILFQYKPEGGSSEARGKQGNDEKSEFKSEFEKHCNAKLIDTDDVKRRLDTIVEYRKKFKPKEKRDLSRNNKSNSLYNHSDGCYNVENNTNNKNIKLHQAGIELRSFNVNKSKNNKPILDYKLYMTDSLTTNIINMPYELQHLYREYHYPFGSVASGRAILESCLIKVAYQLRVNKTRLPKKISWSILADPIRPDPQQIPILFMVLSITAFTINGTFILMRLTDDIEMGVYHYLRMSGVSAMVYWSSHFITTIVHLFVENFIICLILAVPVAVPNNQQLFDPIFEMSFSIKYLMLCLLSVVYTVHLMAVSLFFTKTTHAVAVYGLIYLSCNFHILLFVVSWGPACFTSFLMTGLLMLLPMPVYTNMLIVISGISMKTGDPFGWTHIGMVLSYSGQFEYSIGQLLSIQILQVIFWACVVIIRDKQLLSSDKWRPTIMSCLCETAFSLSCLFDSGMLPISDKQPSRLNKVNPERRVACSLRQICVDGVHLKLANLERFSSLFREKSQSEVKRYTLAAMNYIASHKVANNSKSLEKNKVSGAKTAQGNNASNNADSNNNASITNNMNIVTPEQLLQQQKNSGFANVSMDFSYNQISYIIGAAQFKELLFAIILGFRTPDSGKILIDGREFPHDVRDSFRRQIGYLGERDIFFGNMSSFENLQFFGAIRDPCYRSYDSESNYVLSLLHLTGSKDASPDLLTTRSLRKLSLAVAIVGHTKVLLLVEPTLGLRWKPRCQVLNLLKKYKTIRSILVDTTDIDEAVTCGDKIVLLRDERVEFDESPQKLKQQLKCGYRIRFTPVTSSNKRLNLPGLKQFLQTAFGSDAIGILEKWSSSLSEEEKSKRALSNFAIKSSKRIKSVKSNATSNVIRDSLILCVRPGSDGNKGLKTMSEKFLNIPSKTGSSGRSYYTDGGLFGFKITLIDFESLEDIIVSRIGYQNYPDLPTDLLASLSLDMRENATRSQSKVILDSNLVDFNFSPLKIFKDRFSGGDKKYIVFLSLIIPLISVATCLTLANMTHSLHDDTKPNSLDATRLYINRVGFYTYHLSTQSGEQNISHSVKKLVDLWPGRSNIKRDLGDITYLNDLDHLRDALNKSRGLLAGSIYMDTYTGKSTIFYASSLPYSIIATLRMFGQFLFEITSNGLDLDNTKQLNYDTKYESTYRSEFEEFHHEWHAILNDIITRRYYYGVGFGISEGLAIGSMVLTPGRHLLEPRVYKIKVYYWVSLGVCDLLISTILNIGYMILFVLVEGISNKMNMGEFVSFGTIANQSVQYPGCLIMSHRLILISLWPLVLVFMMLTLYKVAVLPFAYLTTLASVDRWWAFLFILLCSMILCWDLGLIIITFVDYTLVFREGQYQTARWLLNIFPINALMHSLTTISHSEMIQRLCEKVPIFLQVKGLYVIDENIVEPTGQSLMGQSLEKIEECLQTGKQSGECRLSPCDYPITKIHVVNFVMCHKAVIGYSSFNCLFNVRYSVSLEVVNGGEFGILWDVYMMVAFATLAWIFLLASEQAFGLATLKAVHRDRRRSVRTQSANRSNSPSSGKNRWIKEKNRLVDEYSKCINEKRYVSLMMKNCFFVRIWFKPTAEKRMIEKCQDLAISPLVEGGQPKDEIKIELQTTLQMFIRVGTAAKLHRLNRANLIDAYSKLMSKNDQTLSDFAIVDWSREILYKVLLHGHYNAKSSNI